MQTIETRVLALHIALFHELIIVHVREENSVDSIIHNDTETALGGDETKLLIIGLFGEHFLHLVGCDLGVSAFPAADELQVRPEVLELRLRMLRKNLTQELSPLRIRLDNVRKLFAHGIGNIVLVRDGSLLDVLDKLLEVRCR